MEDNRNNPLVPEGAEEEEMFFLSKSDVMELKRLVRIDQGVETLSNTFGTPKEVADAGVVGIEKGREDAVLLMKKIFDMKYRKASPEVQRVFDIFVNA